MKRSARLAASELASIDDRIMPLINIVFLLLIFFLVAGAIREVEPVQVDPPRSIVEAESVTDALTIYVARDGRIALGETMLDLLDRTSPVPTPPQILQATDLTFTVPIAYSLN